MKKKKQHHLSLIQQHKSHPTTATTTMMLLPKNNLKPLLSSHPYSPPPNHPSFIMITFFICKCFYISCCHRCKCIFLIIFQVIVKHRVLLVVVDGYNESSLAETLHRSQGGCNGGCSQFIWKYKMMHVGLYVLSGLTSA